MRELTAYEQLHGFLDDLESSLDMDLPDFDCDNIVLCGMGGSAISGSITADIFNGFSKKYIHTLRNPIIPDWMDERTLAVISSYSGNTLETIRMYERARAQGCTLIVITAGGRLKEMAEKDGNLLMTVKPGMDPRHSIGFMIGYLACIMKHTGTDLIDEFKGAIPELRRYRDELEEGSRVIGLSSSLKDKVAMLLFDGGMKSVALRWKSELTENGKYIAMTKPLSDLSDPNICNDFVHNALHAVIFAKDVGEDSFAGKAMQLLDSRSVGYDVLKAPSDSIIINTLSMIMLGDYTSVKMANDRGADPRDVWPIMKLKKLLNERMNDR